MVGKSWAYCLQKEVQARPAARLDIVIQKVNTNGLPCARPRDVRDNNPFIRLLVHSFNNWPLSSRPVLRGQKSGLTPQDSSPQDATLRVRLRNTIVLRSSSDPPSKPGTRRTAEGQ